MTDNNPIVNKVIFVGKQHTTVRPHTHQTHGAHARAYTTKQRPYNSNVLNDGNNPQGYPQTYPHIHKLLTGLEGP